MIMCFGRCFHREIARHSTRDAETYMRFGPRMGQIGMAVALFLKQLHLMQFDPLQIFQSKNLIESY